MAVSVAAPSPRSEPLLWLQLLALGLLPLEALLLLLLLGASDPGSLPLLERLLCWAIGVLAPAALLWRLPVDPWSLLVAQVPQRARREIQQRLSALQPPAVLRLGSLVGLAILSLVLLWWCDNHAAFASAFSPVADSPRLVGLLLAAAVLALLQWQGQQVVQALWLLSRSPQQLEEQGSGRSVAFTDSSVLSLGLPVLLLPPLAGAAPYQGQDQISPPSKTSSEGSGIQSPDPEPSALPATATATDSSAAASPVAIEPEQASEEREGDDLDQEVD